MLRVVLFCLVSGLISVRAQQPGAAPEWEARRDLAVFPERVKRMLPVLEQLHPDEWVAKGASEVYVQQWKSVQAEVGYLQQTADALAQQPDRLTLALEALFRLQAIDTRMTNLVEAIRKYQNPALADLVQSIAAENSTVRVGLQQYIKEVAAQRESEWKVMEAEAQRCRTQVTAPAAKPAPARKQ